jgi:aspartate ammonia-lyase
VRGITANRDRLKDYVNNSVGIATALNPYIGYAKATEVAQEALLTGRGVADLVLEKQLLTEEQLRDILRPETLTRPIETNTSKPSKRKVA